jgi:hypothetical protein
MGNALDTSETQDTVQRYMDAAVTRVGPNAPAALALRARWDEWRRSDAGGKQAWAWKGAKPDGTPYPLTAWKAEGGELARLAAELGQVSFSADGFGLAPEQVRHQVRRGRAALAVAGVGGLVALGLAAFIRR